MFSSLTFKYVLFRDGDMIALSIIIPAYNESQHISELLTRVKNVNLSKLNVEKEIIVIDDGSKDNTASIVETEHSDVILLKHPLNLGKGAAIRTGIARAAGDIILIQDSDLEYNPDEYPRLIKPLLNGEAHVVYGSRYLAIDQKRKNTDFLKKQHKKAYNIFYIGGRLLTTATNLLYGANITDEATCYKVFKKEVLNNIKLDCQRFEFCPEVTAKTIMAGYSIKEVPISYNPRRIEEGKKIKFKDGIECLKTLIKYRLAA